MTDALSDTLRKAVRSGGPCYTHFLDPAAGREFLGSARKEGLEGGCWGGVQDAERVVCACWMDGYDPETWPVAALSITWSEQAGSLGHRDILGAVLGLGIERDHIGDIRVGNHKAWLAAEPGIAAYLTDNLRQAGRVTVRVEPAKEAIGREQGRGKKVSLSSYRLDAVLAAAMDMSRAKAQEWIRSGRVQRNWREEIRPDREVASGDVLSVRGKGRVVVGETGGISRKGRYHVDIETFWGNGP